MQLENEVIGQNIDSSDTAVENAIDENKEVPASEEAEKPEEVEAEDGATDDGIEEEITTIRKSLHKKNRHIKNQLSKIRSLENEMHELRSNMRQNVKPAPQMEQFDSVLDYVRADSTHALEQKFTEQQQQQQLSALEQQQVALRQQQDAEIEQGLSELVTTNSDAKAVLSQALPVIQVMPPQMQSLFYEIDDAPAAVYALAKEGKLQDLYYMNQYVAAAELVQAQYRGQQYLNASSPQLQQQKPPKPLDGLKGRGSQSGRPLHEKSDDELMKWLNS